MSNDLREALEVVRNALGLKYEMVADEPERVALAFIEQRLGAYEQALRYYVDALTDMGYDDGNTARAVLGLPLEPLSRATPNAAMKEAS